LGADDGADCVASGGAFAIRLVPGSWRAGAVFDDDLLAERCLNRHLQRAPHQIAGAASVLPG